MAPNSRIILTRHAQAEHNVDLDYSSKPHHQSTPKQVNTQKITYSPVPDAPLTPLGRKQAASLAPRIPTLQTQANLIITSPLKRTLQTTLLGWGPAIKRLGISNVICLPAAQECNDLPCDTGSSQSALASDPEFAGFNFERLSPEWTSKRGFWAPEPEALAERARWVRRFLWDRPERDIVLVAHGDVLRRITATREGGPSAYMWRNAEVRIFEFEEGEGGDGGECWLFRREDVAAAGGYAPSSTEMDLDERFADGEF